LTRIRIQDLIEGASDLEAFEKLLRLSEIPGIDVVMKCISNLHAKVYVFDGSSAIVTSSNLTPSGLKSNIEYGIELTDPVAIQRILADMSTYWLAAETVTPDMIERVGERLEATESVVTVNQALKLKNNRPTVEELSLFTPIGKRFAPQGQDIELVGLEELRERISTTSKYRKKSKVVITTPEELVNVPEESVEGEVEADVEDDLTDQEEELQEEKSVIEIEASYGELEEDSVERLISELKADDKQRRKEAQKRLKALFALDNSCIVPHITELASANLSLCCRFLRRLQDPSVVPHLIQILNTAKKEKGSLPQPILKTLNDIAPEKLYSFLCQALKEPLSPKARRNAIEWFKNAIVRLNLEGNDPAIEIFKNLTEDADPNVCNTAYVALGQVGGIQLRDYLRNAFNQAQRRKMPLKLQMSILRGLVAAGVTPDDELMFSRLTYTHIARFRVMSVRALRQIGAKYWQRLSGMAESDPNADVRIEAVRALVDIDATTAHKVLIKLLESDPEERVRTTVYSLLQRLYYESIRELPAAERHLILQHTISELQSSDHKTRRKAAGFLGKIKDVSAVQVLCDALKDEDRIARTKAAEALGLIGDNSSVFTLIEVLENDSYQHARAAAAEALGRIGDKRAVDALVKELNDESVLVRKWCTIALDRIGESR
jgi:HEAT repeat protein